jgi:hypothetical protein
MKGYVMEGSSLYAQKDCKYLQELASHSPFGLNLTADTAFVWPANVNFKV